jgi:hypothetical protein
MLSCVKREMKIDSHVTLRSKYCMCLHPRAPMLCVSTHIFNYIEIFNLIEKVDMSKILNTGLRMLENMNLRCILPIMSKISLLRSTHSYSALFKLSAHVNVIEDNDFNTYQRCPLVHNTTQTLYFDHHCHM